MQSLILAAGYGTRLGTLALQTPKPLLPVGNRVVLDHVHDAVEKVPHMSEELIVTNSRSFIRFEAWSQDRMRHSHLPVKVINDGTHSNEERLGAIGDLIYVFKGGYISDDLLVIAGDNLFDFDLAQFAMSFDQRGISHVGLYDVGSLDRIKNYNEVHVDGKGIVISSIERPADPQSTLAAIAIYLYRLGDLDLLEEYESKGNNLDQAGGFIQWLHTRRPVFGYTFSGKWIDIGTPETYNIAIRDFS